MAGGPDSPVRMRMACSTGRTKSTPSPIWPVRAPRVMASMAGYTKSSLTPISRRTFLSRFTSISAPR